MEHTGPGRHTACDGTPPLGGRLARLPSQTESFDFARWLIVGALTAATALALSAHPSGPLWAFIWLTAGLLIGRLPFPQATFCLLALLPVTSFAPFTGSIFVEECDFLWPGWSDLESARISAKISARSRQACPLPHSGRTPPP